jgi:hypothetical protein
MKTNINLNEQSYESQSKMIKEYLLSGGSISPLDALKMFGCFRLGARIWDLRHKEGMDIKKETLVLDNNKRVAVYTLIS